jgi:CRP-like cAMP-binding protein
MRDEKRDELRRLPLFHDLTEDQLSEVERLADQVSVPAGEVLFRQGQVANEFVIVVEGTIEIKRNGAHVTDLVANDFLGEISLVLDRPRTTTAICRTPCRLIVFALREFHTLMDDLEHVRVEILNTLAHRLAPAR